MKYAIFLLFLFIITTQGEKRGFGPGEQDYGYVEVREGAHMFWWFFHTTADVPDSSDRPLILFLVGGPGGSSTGYGNFMLAGPTDELLEERENTWVKDFNVLFVDSPVGSGYSYVDDLQLLNDNNEEAAKDLLELLRQFYEQQPKFKNSPLYVFGFGYGSKIGTEFIKMLYGEVKAGRIEANIKGMSSSSPWISAINILLNTAEFLYQFSLVDEKGRDLVNQQTFLIKHLLESGNNFQATYEWLNLYDLVYAVTDGVDYENVMNKITNSSKLNPFNFINFSNRNEEDLLALMNGPVKKALGIPSKVFWALSSIDVLKNLFEDYLLPVTHIVEDLLNNTEISFYACNGNLDLINNTPGQHMWINKLNWNRKNDYLSASRRTMWINNTMEGYYKSGGGLTFYWINVAGRNIMEENPKATREFLKLMTGF